LWRIRPRDIGGEELATLLRKFGEIARTTGSHLRLTTYRDGEHSVTIPKHGALRVGTPNRILTDVAGHLRMTKDDLIGELFG